jgi:hypothetical protein
VAEILAAMSFNIELVPAMLTPFDWAALSGIGNGPGQTASPIANSGITGFQQQPVNSNLSALDQANIGATIGANGLSASVSGQFNFGSVTANLGLNGLTTSGSSIYPPGHPLYPLTQTGGLVFPFNPVISENLGVRYDSTELTHTNESIHAYKNTENVRINLADCIWVADTFDQAIYTIGVIQFFRSFTLMDFGRAGPGTGKPPSPMWFNAYGNYMYCQVPVLIEHVDWAFPQDIDYVGVPNPGTDAYNNQTLSFSTANNVLGAGANVNGYTWIPIKFTVNSISMVVQHSINYWVNEFSLAAFQSGQLIGQN